MATALHSQQLVAAAGRLLEAADVAEEPMPFREVPRFRFNDGGGGEVTAERTVDWPALLAYAMRGTAEHPAVKSALVAIDRDLPSQWRLVDRQSATADLLRAILSMALERAFRDGGRKLSGLARETDVACKEFHRFCDTASFKVVHCCPVTVACPSGERVEIDRHIRLRRLRVGELSDVWARLGYVPSLQSAFPSPDLNDLQATYAVIELEGEFSVGEPLPYDTIQHPRHLVLDAIRLAVPGRVYELGAYDVFPSFPEMLRSLTFGGGVMRPLRTSGPARPGERQVVGEDTELPQIWAGIRDRESRCSPRQLASFDLALQRFRYAYQRGSDEDKLIDAWIALEALFLHDSPNELVYRAALRISRVVQPDPSQRAEQFRRVKVLYNARSKVAHGVAGRDKQRIDLPGLAEEAVDLLRRALVVWLQPTTPREGSDMDLLLLDASRAET